MLLLWQFFLQLFIPHSALQKVVYKGKTPASVKKLVEEMAQQREQQSKKLTEVLTVQEQGVPLTHHHHHQVTHRDLEKSL
ncbi:hypothetical protein PN471_22315 [Aphanizomenon sp. CS-733/32]|uniref:hypothetical protein n=1 Tax=Aphanizomenon sp. CS-733/32 TaxID=3021715 RepID=UPI00232ED0C5|nr:hypothetical protein [Aphanizomenon sp. CS-733/32]MDB9311313.1 hypothetical protein [Aphanizomenon sp. CS-733/32]